MVSHGTCRRRWRRLRGGLPRGLRSGRRASRL